MRRECSMSVFLFLFLLFFPFPCFVSSPPTPSHTATWPALLPSQFDAELAPRFQSLQQSLKECERVLREDCDARIVQEIEKKYGNANAAAGGAGGDSGAADEGEESTFLG